MAETWDTLVVGGGLAGISAALELRRAGQRVLLVDRSPKLGGKAGSTETAAGEFPTGPTSFNGRAPAFWRLLELLELKDDAVVRLDPRSAARFVVRGGKLRALRPNPLSVIFTGALTLSEKWALAREFLFPRAAASPSGDESLHALLVRRFGESAVEHFFSAVFSGIFAGDLRKLSAQTCMPSLVAAEKEYGSVVKGLLQGMGSHEPNTRPGLYTFANGFGVIGRRAAELVPSRLGASVEALAFTPGGVAARVGGEVLHARALVLATEAPEAAALLKDAAPGAARVLETFEYAPVSLVQWAETKEVPSALPAGFGYLSAPCEGLFGMGTLFVGDLRGEAPRRFSTFIGGAMNPDRASLPDDELVRGVEADLGRLGAGRVGEVCNVVRWPRAVFQPAVGHGALLSRLGGELGSLPVVLAGSYFGAAAMKDALRSGFEAAERVRALPPVEAAERRAS